MGPLRTPPRGRRPAPNDVPRRTRDPAPHASLASRPGRRSGGRRGCVHPGRERRGHDEAPPLTDPGGDLTAVGPAPASPSRAFGAPQGTPRGFGTAGTARRQPLARLERDGGPRARAPSRPPGPHGEGRPVQEASLPWGPGGSGALLPCLQAGDGASHPLDPSVSRSIEHLPIRVSWLSLPPGSPTLYTSVTFWEANAPLKLPGMLGPRHFIPPNDAMHP